MHPPPLSLPSFARENRTNLLIPDPAATMSHPTATPPPPPAGLPLFKKQVATNQEFQRKGEEIKAQSSKLGGNRNGKARCSFLNRMFAPEDVIGLHAVPEVKVRMRLVLIAYLSCVPASYFPLKF
jgi:hypothetical protein